MIRRPFGKPYKKIRKKADEIIEKRSKSTKEEENWNAANVVNLAIMWGYAKER